ncbi:MAG: hypothetical protein IKK10_04565 [Clostridia bacterium]|nr:hypothetical protein [Clostridia bacterium]
MFKFFSALLDKMGSWFGIIFKIILPGIVMYRPVKMFAFAVMVFGTTLGGDITSFDKLGIVIFYMLYAILVLMLFLFPKVASAMEFCLMAFYFVCLIVFNFIDFFSNNFVGLSDIVRSYSYALPLVLIFLIGKILFYIFITANREKIEEGRKVKFSRFEGLR